MRIVGGEFRGRNLATPKSNDIRPTVDRTRESLFNILAHAHPGLLDGTRILDLFAGTGVPSGSRLCRAAANRRCSSKTASRSRASVGKTSRPSPAWPRPHPETRRDRSRSLEQYRAIRNRLCRSAVCKGLGEKALLAAHQGGWLAPGALAILEERADVQVAVDPVFNFIEQRTFGDTKMYFFSYRPD